jgi:sec-independent protein translocase protein TatA
MFGLGFGELAVILIIVVLFFGPRRFGDFGGELGRAIRSFRKEMNQPDAIDVSPKDDAKDSPPESAAEKK